MIKYQIFSENEWLFPDSEITVQNKAELYSARNADVCFQILTDLELKGDEKITASFELEGFSAEVSQLLIARVHENSAVKSHTTLDYESVKHFVTRQAPFDVYDVTRPIEDNATEAGRAAFYVRINVFENAPVGIFDTTLTLNIGDESLTVPVTIKTYNVKVPALKDAEFDMCNWIYYEILAKDTNTTIYSDEYMAIVDEYIKNLVDMRNTMLMLPTASPIRDENGKVVDFDFSGVEKVGNLAIERGFNYVMGGFVASWAAWDKPEIYLLWDREIEVRSIEAYRQLKLYFKRAVECIERNNWEDVYMQCLVDEPQFQNADAYRALSGICRQCMPGITINDPVETTDIEGALDIWVIKQATFEQYLADFQAIQATGETLMIYTCGFPSGKTMNRVIDLPLTVSRLPMWMCYKYDCPGFLHWGYHYHQPEGRWNTHTPGPKTHKHPAGNGFVAYLFDNKPYYAVRGHSQRTGACDYELFNILGKTDKAKALELIHKVCRTFDDYDPSTKLFDDVRRELLEILG